MTDPSPTEGNSPTLMLPSAAAVEDGGALVCRESPEPDHAYRSPFARDCGRILHARAFRRLAGKTQVFTRSQTESDHSRSRLTHTLEVAQIARTIAETLGLNIRLAEALALVHDIGHPPFGHAGEKALDRALQAHGLRFDHNLHALRIVTGFEQRCPAFPGLNLTLAVREGIVKHSRDYRAQEHPELSAYLLDQFPPIEAQLIDLADEIAYLTADTEDGLEAGILDLDAVRDGVPLFARHYAQTAREFPAAPTRLLRNEALKAMLNAMVTDLIEEIRRQARELGIDSLEAVRRAPRRIALLSAGLDAEREVARRFLYANLYQSEMLEAEHRRASEIVQSLFDAWVSDPELLPDDHRLRVQSEGAPRAVADYIAGMTDSYIESAWQSWSQHQTGESR